MLSMHLRWLPIFSETKYYRVHLNIDLLDYFMFMKRRKMKLGNSMFPRLEISETNKFCKAVSMATWRFQNGRNVKTFFFEYFGFPSVKVSNILHTLI